MLLRDIHTVLSYSHNDINNNNYNTDRLCRFGYERVYFFLPSVLGDMKRELQFLRAYANHTTLPLHTVHLVVFKTSTNLSPSRPELICFDQIQKTQLNASTVECKLLSFQNPQILGPFLPGTSTTISIYSNGCPFPVPFWGLIMTHDDCYILSAWA